MQFRYTAKTPAEAKQAVVAASDLSANLKGFLAAMVDEVKPTTIDAEGKAVPLPEFGVQINASQDATGTLVHVHMVL